MYRNLVCLLIALGLAAATGCSISASSESISKSISSPFKSSSASSSDDESDKKEEPEKQQTKESYQEDVRQLAITYAQRGGAIGAFRSQIASLASARGIMNWEADETTCQSIGEGARQGGMTPDKFSDFSGALCYPPAAQTSLRQGYDDTAQ